MPSDDPQGLAELIPRSSEPVIPDIPPSQAEGDFARQLSNVLAWPSRAELHFQPIVDLRAGVVAGYEALARFPREAGMPPNLWFEKAGPLGRRNELQKLMARKALHARSLLPQNCFLTVNVAPDYLVSPAWQELLEEFSNLSAVVVEITEETSIADYDRIRAVIAQIRRSGGLVAVDDAGAGYASLHHILEIKPDFIKIDRHFVQNCGSDRARSTMIEMVGAAASRLDAWIVAEGVELISELEELLRLEVPLAQGYLLGRPAPEMAQGGVTALQAIQARRLQWEGAALARHLRSCAAFPTREAAIAALSAGADGQEVVVVDRWQRPLELVQRHPLVGIRTVPGVLRAQVSSSAAELLQRALAREESLRFDPIVVIGAAGETLGVVSVDELMRAVLAERPSEGPANGGSEAN